MLRPSDEMELAEAIREAEAPLTVVGGGTRSDLEATLTTEAMTGISLYEPGALTLVAQAGTPLSEVEAALRAENQRLAFEPMDHRRLLDRDGEPTIGGVAAANVSGPRRVAVGACRDFMLGVRFVDGAGTVVKNGGRVMKNVTGYDLVKLMTGARGTLGVLTEVSLKVLPCPETETTLVLRGLSPARAVRAMSAALGSPFEVTGAAHGSAGEEEPPQTCLRLEGFAASVAYRAGELRRILADFGEAEEMAAEASEAWWRECRDAAAFARMPHVWRAHVRPSRAAEVLDPNHFL